MSLSHRIQLATILIASAGFAQELLPAQTVSTPVRPTFTPFQFAEPPVPADPLELVSGDAQTVQDVTQRAEIINLLVSARRHGNIKLTPYDLKTHFTAFGASGSDGSWQLEDIVAGQGGLYRWTAQGPSYSVVNLYSNRVLYSSQTAASIPLRLAQVRDAIFFMQPMLGPRASIRTASASLNGAELVCALVSHGNMAKGVTGGRRWEETEFCVDPKSLNVITYSPIPGLYVLYDYSKALHINNEVIADKFTITQAGHTIVEAQTDSITNPPDDPSTFQTAGLNKIGVGTLMTEPWRVRMFLPATAGGGNTSGMVVLHGMQLPNGHLTDVELIASTNAALNSAALEYTAGWQPGIMGAEVESGATPQSHEVLLMLQYHPVEAPAAQ